MSAAVMQEGIVHAGHYKVTQRGAGANQSVDVAAGEAWVDGDNAVDQGYYHVVNDATVNVAVAAANGSNPRIDAIVLAINDATEVGGSDEYKLESISGTATAGATLANLKGAPAIGSTKLLLAYVLVPTSSTSVINERIGNLIDPRAGVAGYPAKAEPFAVEGAPPQYAHGHPLGYVPTCRVRHNANQTPGARKEILFNTEDFDNDEMHSVAINTGRIICKTPGVYKITLQLQNAAGAEACVIGLNGTEVANDRAFINAGGAAVIIELTFRLKYNDFITAYIGGAGATNTSGSYAPAFSATWLAP